LTSRFNRVPVTVADGTSGDHEAARTTSRLELYEPKDLSGVTDSAHEGSEYASEECTLSTARAYCAHACMLVCFVVESHGLRRIVHGSIPSFSYSLHTVIHRTYGVAFVLDDLAAWTSGAPYRTYLVRVAVVEEAPSGLTRR
jgi:hypothetical protein